MVAWLWWLGCVSLELTWSSFFDDFITFCRQCEWIVGVAIQQFFALLGWQVSAGDKDLPFFLNFKALGIEISLEECNRGSVIFKNTERRVRELVETLGFFLDKGRMSQQEALSLRGRMQFAKAQIWGRSARLCLAAITDHAYKVSGDELGQRAKDSMAIFRECLVSAPPWRISCIGMRLATFSPVHHSGHLTWICRVASVVFWSVPGVCFQIGP